MNRLTLQKHIERELAKAFPKDKISDEFSPDPTVKLPPAERKLREAVLAAPPSLEWRKPAPGQRVAWVVSGRLDRSARYATRSRNYVQYNQIVRVPGFEYGKDQWGRYYLKPHQDADKP